MIFLRPILGTDAITLFPLIHHTRVTDTLLWDGPEKPTRLTSDLTEREKQTRLGESFMYTIALAATGAPIGTCSIRPNNEKYRGDLGLWIGESYHGKGYGSVIVRELKRISFEQIGLQKLEATVFVGNAASRRIFEKNGFLLEGTIRKAVLKRGKLLDEWLFGITREEYLAVRK